MTTKALGILVAVRRMRLAVITLVLASACGDSDGSVPIPTAIDSLIGTWRVAGHMRPAAADTSSALPFGPRPRIEGEFLPRSGQTERATPFRFRPDSLILGADSLERWSSSACGE